MLFSRLSSSIIALQGEVSLILLFVVRPIFRLVISVFVLVSIVRRLGGFCNLLLDHLKGVPSLLIQFLVRVSFISFRWGRCLHDGLDPPVIVTVGVEV